MNGLRKSDVSLGELAADMEIRGESAEPPGRTPIPLDLGPGPHNHSSSSSTQVLEFPTGKVTASCADLVAELRAAWDRQRINRFELPNLVWKETPSMDHAVPVRRHPLRHT